MSLRIVSGQFKGRILQAPKGSTTRPTQEMLRGAVFNICQHEIQGSQFLDLFAGSGAMGLEALSRGAEHATFIEKNRNALAAIRENILSLQVALQSTVIGTDVETALKRIESSFDIIYVDPPYHISADSFVTTLLNKNLLRENGLLFLEASSRHHQDPPIFSSLREEEIRSETLKPGASRCKWIGSRRFGDATLHQYRNCL